MAVREAELDRRLYTSLPVVAPEALGPLRDLTRAGLAVWGLASVADTVVLGVVELVTNVLKHTDGGCVVTLLAGTGDLLVTVRDFDHTLPVLGNREDDEAESGRGLLLLSLLADELTVEPLASGKRVGFRLIISEKVKEPVR